LFFAGAFLPWLIPTSMLPLRLLLSTFSLGLVPYVSLAVVAAVAAVVLPRQTLDVICHGEHCYPKLFEPTHEFKEILPEQEVPAGLHIQLDFASGKRFAKLIDLSDITTTSSSSSSNSMVVQLDHNEHEIASPAPISDAEKTQKVYDDTHRMYSYGQPSKTPLLQSDQDQYDFAILVLEAAASGGTEAAHPDHVLEALKTLEELVHEMRFGTQFAERGGMKSTVAILESEAWASDVRAKAATAIGSSAQNNPKVQHSALQLDLVSRLVHLLQRSTISHEVISRLLYALSSLLRGYPQAMEAFNAAHGLSQLHLLYLSMNGNEEIQQKIMVLVTDFLDPDMHDTNEQVNMQDSEVRLWCISMLKEMEKPEESDLVEAAFSGLEIMGTWYSSLCADAQATLRAKMSLKLKSEL